MGTFYFGGAAWSRVVLGEGDSEAVYLERGAGWSRSFVEPNKRDRPKKPDEPDPRHAPGNGSQTKTPDPFVFSMPMHL